MIYDEEKMNQKPVYPTKRTPSYADWALFDMGAELEEVIDGITQELADLPAVPTPTVADAGTYVKVDSEGAYELADLPEVVIKHPVDSVEDFMANDIFFGTVVDTNTYKGVFLATVIEGTVTLSPIVAYDITSSTMKTTDIVITVAEFAGSVAGYKI